MKNSVKTDYPYFLGYLRKERLRSSFFMLEFLLCWKFGFRKSAMGHAFIRLFCLLTCYLTVVVTAQAANPLKSYNVAPAAVSLSGESAGGYMASQLGVAYSSLFPDGIAVFEGGPFDCIRTNQFGQCWSNGTPDISASIANMRSWSGSQIDNVANLANIKFYLYIGLSDTLVGPNVADQLQAQLLNFTASSNIKYVRLAGAVHGVMPTDTFASTFGWLFGTLNPPNTGTLKGQFLLFDQTAFIATGQGMGDTGILYVPANCANGQSCKLHVFLHGSNSNYQTRGINTAYYLDKNAWADTNNIIVMYPQTSNESVNSFDGHNGQWDHRAIYSSGYDWKTAPQNKAIADMVKKITSGYQATTTASDCLLSWAEKKYPDLLAPPTTSQSASPYYFRFFSATNAYLGVASNNYHLYYFSASGLADLGLAASWYSAAGCT